MNTTPLYWVDTDFDEIVECVNSLEILERENVNTRAKKRVYVNTINAFDIETTALRDIEQSIMYIWQYQLDDRCTICGRTWEEYKQLVDILNKKAEELDAYFLVFVHFLSHEFQYLRSVFDFTVDEVFVVKSRRILKATSGRIEYRCSYLLSNMSLDQFTKKMGVDHRKESGEEYNYSITRYPWTALTDIELRYCVNDVIGLVEALKIQMDIEGDSLYTLPLTSTGYIRREAKVALLPYKKSISRMTLDENLYRKLREAFRGGNTHANRYYAGTIIGPVYSADRSSSYPDVQCNDKYPMEPFVRWGDVTRVKLEQLIYEKEKPVLFRVVFYDIRLKDRAWGCPYISIDKSRALKRYISDNGRILWADICEMTLTDIDYRIIADEYIWEAMAIYDASVSKYGKLPRELLDVTINAYRDKTALKNKKGSELYYEKQKNKLNSVYGMSAQNPVKPNIIYTGGAIPYQIEDTPLCELIEEANKKLWMPYQWGVWVTAHARYRLEEGIKLAGDDFVYCDTDCVKSLSPIDWTSYNEERISASLRSGAYGVDAKGVTHYMGVYETEETIDRFITWGAKRYVEEIDGIPYVTVSGVSRRLVKNGGGYIRISSRELLEMGGLEKFKPGIQFRDSGGVVMKYQDVEPFIISREGKEILVTSNVYSEDSTYTLGIATPYDNLLKEIKKEFCY